MTENRVQYSCPYCGRRWDARTKAPGTKTGWTGFLDSSVSCHKSFCEDRTPEERWKVNKQAERRNTTRPPKHTIITFDWEHQGMKDPIVKA
ncbi:hypothetical protein LCGC14_2519370 [marine sediment metagenome]|uniref:Uncharacterized protein n=1 Tax=marine sediment metagenome TaxID=412755 RepID=A0A0F9BJT9_9ZZZZ